MKALTILVVLAAIAVALTTPAERLTRESAACTSEVYAYLLPGGSLSADQYITISSDTWAANNSCDGHTFDTYYNNCAVSAGCDPMGTGSVDIAGTALSGNYRVLSVDNGCITMCRCQ